MPEIPSWLIFECVIQEIEKKYPGLNTEQTNEAVDTSGVRFQDYALLIPQKSVPFNIRVYLPDRVVQEDRMQRVCKLLNFPIEKLYRNCGVKAKSFR